MNDTYLILATKTTRTFGYGILGVLLGLYLEKSKYDPQQVGLILSLALFGSALLTSVFVARADHVGRRRILIISALLMGLSGLALALADNVWLLILAALSGTVSASVSEVGPFETIEQTMLPQTVASERRTQIFGAYSTLAALALAGGSLIAGFTEPLGVALGLGVLGGYRVMFGLYAVLGLATALMFAALSKHVEAVAINSPSSAQTPIPAQARFAALGQSRAFVLKLASLFALDAFGGGFVLQSIISYWFSQRFGVGPAVIGPVFTVLSFVKALSFPIAVWLAKRFGLINTMVFSHIPSNVLLMLLPFAPSVPLAIAVLLLRQVLSQMDVPTRNSYLAGIVPPQERIAANGVINLTRTITQAISPSIAGFAIALSNLSAPFLLGGVIKIVYDVLLYVNFKDVKPPEEQRIRGEGS